MKDDEFIFLIKAKLKQYYLENKSVGLELKALVAQFRQEIEDDILNFKYQEPKTTEYDHYNNETKAAGKVQSFRN